MKIGKNKVVTFDYVLKDGEGNILENTNGEGSVYLHGFENLIPALEEALEGKEPGDKLSKFLTVDEAFGKYDETLVIKIPESEFGDEKPEIGQEILIPDDEDEENIFEIVKIENGEITLDGNHPYADKELNFDITIVDVRDATAEEIENGDVDCGCDCDDDEDDCGCGCCH